MDFPAGPGLNVAQIIVDDGGFTVGSPRGEEAPEEAGDAGEVGDVAGRDGDDVVAGVVADVIGEGLDQAPALAIVQRGDDEGSGEGTHHG